MRMLVALATLLLVAGCGGTGPDAADVPAGCGLLPADQLAGVVGDDTTSTGRGSVRALREDHRRASCRIVDAGDRSRFVELRAMFHPDPYELPSRACSEGWVYAGTPEKYTPACQEYVDGRGSTELIVRWQPYVMRVTIGRPDRQWGGDPERALELSRGLATRLGVQEAAADR